jgi:hypothetical protein
MATTGEISAEVGTEQTLGVVQSTSFAVFHAEMFVVYALPTGTLSMMAHAFEGRSANHIVTVAETNGKKGLQPKTIQGGAVLVEQGGVRATTDAALDLVDKIFEALATFDMVPREQISQVLKGLLERFGGE